MPAELAKGTVPTQTLSVGNTLPARQFAFTLNEAPANATLAYFAVKTPQGVQLLRTTCSISGNIVTRPEVSENVTSEWPAGRLNWDIKIYVSGQAKTYIGGQFNMLTTAQ